MQTKQDLIYSYLINTKFYGNLRNKLSGTLSGQELKQLVNGIQAIVRYKCESILCQFDQPVIVVVIYGEVEVQLHANAQINGVQNEIGKAIKKVYSKGEYFRIEKDLKSIPMTFLKATTLVLLNSEVLDHRISQIITIRQKIKLVQKCMPIKQLKLTLSELRKVAKLFQLKEVKGKYQKIQGKPGIYLFYQGIFQVCNRDNSQIQNIHTLVQKQNSENKEINPETNNKEEVIINQKKEEIPNLFINTKNNHFYESPFLQMQNNFIEITEQLEFGIRLKTMEGKYGCIGRKQFYSLIEPDAAIQMQKCWKNKLQIRDYYNSKKQYILQSQKLRQKIKLKIRKGKKMSRDEKEKHDTFYNQSLQLSRKTMLQKCSVYTAREFSVKSSRKTPTTPTLKKAKSLSATNWTFKKQKEEESKLGSKHMINQYDNISERLTKMRIHSDKKAQSRVKFQKQWYYLDENKMSQSLNMSYYKIKKQETKAQNIRQMCNYKRVHRIYSDPCFKKQLSFRNCWFY